RGSRQRSPDGRRRVCRRWDHDRRGVSPGSPRHPRPRSGRVSAPLDGIRVLAVEQFGAGPWGTLQLADLGAEVIKIESPDVGGDVGRYVPPYNEGTSSLFFESFNRGKRSIALDLRVPDGRSVFEDLVRHSDAVFSNLRGDQPAKQRLRYEDLAPI